MSFSVYGPGAIFITRTDVPNQTPINIGYSQEFSISEDKQLVENYGEKQYALDIALGTIKATGKMKAARVSGLAINAAFHGETLTTGAVQMQRGELTTLAAATTAVTSAATAANGTTLTFAAAPAGVVIGTVVVGTNIANGTYATAVGTTITLSQPVTGTGVALGETITFGPSYTAANGANFNQDLGVVYNSGANAGLPFLYVPGAASNSGQYSVNATSGSYFFHPNDGGKQISFTYAWNNATVGQTKIVLNHELGYTPTFQIDYGTVFQGKFMYVRVFKGVSTKLNRKFDLKTYSNPEIDFAFMGNASDQVYMECYPEQS